MSGKPKLWKGTKLAQLAPGPPCMLCCATWKRSVNQNMLLDHESSKGVPPRRQMTRGGNPARLDACRCTLWCHPHTYLTISSRWRSGYCGLRTSAACACWILNSVDMRQATWSACWSGLLTLSEGKEIWMRLARTIKASLESLKLSENVASLERSFFPKVLLQE